jgi:hypothetical protein
MKMHGEVLDEAQSELLPVLGSIALENGFYLGGGTAIALVLGHRMSVDFDWFGSSLDDPMILAQTLREGGLNPGNLQVSPSTLHCTINGVRVSFLKYAYPLLGDSMSDDSQAFALASLDDLSCMKLAAVAQRGLRRDFVDVYALGTRHKPLPDMLDLYKRKYSTDDISHVLKALTYFDDAEDEPMPSMIWDLSWETIKLKITDWVREQAISPSGS